MGQGSLLCEAFEGAWWYSTVYHQTPSMYSSVYSTVSHAEMLSVMEGPGWDTVGAMSEPELWEVHNCAWLLEDICPRRQLPLSLWVGQGGAGWASEASHRSSCGPAQAQEREGCPGLGVRFAELGLTWALEMRF
jgi:hypothetical protein